MKEVRGAEHGLALRCKVTTLPPLLLDHLWPYSTDSGHSPEAVGGDGENTSLLAPRMAGYLSSESPYNGVLAYEPKPQTAHHRCKFPSDIGQLLD